MNPIDYWYQKYLKTRQELTWEDIMTIDVLLQDISDEKCTVGLKEFYEEGLRRYNKLKEK